VLVKQIVLLSETGVRLFEQDYQTGPEGKHLSGQASYAKIYLPTLGVYSQMQVVEWIFRSLIETHHDIGGGHISLVPLLSTHFDPVLIMSGNKLHGRLTGDGELTA